MRTKPLSILATLAFSVATLPAIGQLPSTASSSGSTSSPIGILARDQAAAILPPSVFFRGQTATIQGRNSSGIKLPNGKLILVTLVDTAGYSSALQETYQAYLLNEVPVTVGDRTLAPGAYGFGFVETNRVVVMDIGGNEILHTSTARDAALPRPTPLQILTDPSDSHRFRLYLGRSYVTLEPAAN